MYIIFIFQHAIYIMKDNSRYKNNNIIKTKN